MEVVLKLLAAYYIFCLVLVVGVAAWGCRSGTAEERKRMRDAINLRIVLLAAPFFPLIMLDIYFRKLIHGKSE
jgi:heme/copper-type cytochrome/quinol oxidase subunit 2